MVEQREELEQAKEAILDLLEYDEDTLNMFKVQPKGPGVYIVTLQVGPEDDIEYGVFTKEKLGI